MSEIPRLFALLIDGDNAQASLLPNVLEKLKEYGKPIIKKVFLNKNSLEHWEETINEYSLEPKWIPNNTKGKNAADIALVIDAMDIFSDKDLGLTGFCIVSSDSDFTQLAKYIVGKNRFILGIGEEKTPISFVKACSEFIYIESLIPQPVKTTNLIPPQTVSEVTPQTTKPVPTLTNPNLSFENFLIQAYEKVAKDNKNNGWVQLIEIKEAMGFIDPEFQSREYHNTRLLAEKIKAVRETHSIEIIEIDERLDAKPVAHWIRLDCDMFRFIIAYQHTSVRECDKWVWLGSMGPELKKYPEYESGYSYRGNRYKSLLKAVTEMSQDYPKIIQIKEQGNGASVRHYLYIK